MKKIILVLSLLLITAHAIAETCKIKIYYDTNGNRTQRVLECTYPRPGTDQIIRTEVALAEGFNDLNSAPYQVYPNPAENIVNIKLSAGLLSKTAAITMTDLSGKIIFQQQQVAKEVTAIDLNGLSDGAYFIIITSGNDRYTAKVIKQAGSKY